MKRIACLIIGITLLFSLGMSAMPELAESKTTFITIGTGGVTGVYYPTGGAICKIVNKKRSEYQIRCTVESTGGSVFNINAVLSGDLDFGIAQSDRQYQAVNGLAEWKEAGPQEKLRSVFSIHAESVTLIAAADAGIKEVGDLKDKRVNMGNPGSGQRQNSIDALTAYGLDWEKDIHAEGVKADAAPSLLQDGRIDAFFYTVGHPNGNIKEATAGRRKVLFVPITKINSLLEKYPYYARSLIPVEDYPGAENKEDTPTFGVKATLITSANTPDEVVYAITKEVFENFDEFRSLHPAYKRLTKESMLEGLSAPIHPGALKYYKEAGLVK